MVTYSYLMLVPVVHALAKQFYVQIVGKQPALQTSFRSLAACALQLTECVRDSRKITKIINLGDLSRHFVHFHCLRSKAECVFFVRSFARMPQRSALLECASNHGTIQASFL